MLSQYSDSDKKRALQTIESVEETIVQLIDWNLPISSVDDYYVSPHGMQLLAADCTLITAIGEGVNRVNRVLPNFLSSEFPEVPWHAVVAMRNHIAHGYFELDAEVVFDTIRNDMPMLLQYIQKAKSILASRP